MGVFFKEASTLQFKQSASLLEASANACPNAQQTALQQVFANHAGLEKPLNLAASVGKDVSAPASRADPTIAVLILLVAMMFILCCCAIKQRMSQARQAMTRTWIPPSYGSSQFYIDL